MRFAPTRHLGSRVVPVLHELRYRPARGRRGRPVSPVDDDAVISMLCVSNRPDQLEHVIDTWRSQENVTSELVLVTNAEGYDQVAASRLAGVAGARVVATSAETTLGEALNQGCRACGGQVVAKVDDDDRYAPDYLAAGRDLVRSTGAGVIGKKSHYVYLTESDQTILRVPGHENSRVGRLAGGTLLIHRDVLDEVSFPSLSLGEDIEFCRRVERQGWAVYSGPARGYLQIRGSGDTHTWTANEAELLVRAERIGPGAPDAYWR